MDVPTHRSWSSRTRRLGGGRSTIAGRVGRGAIERHCVLMYKAPTRASGASAGAARIDRRLRDRRERPRAGGPGELLGTRRTTTSICASRTSCVIVSCCPRCRPQAQALLEQDPEPAERVVDRWLGSREHYAEAPALRRFGFACCRVLEHFHVELALAARDNGRDCAPSPVMDLVRIMSRLSIHADDHGDPVCR